jgi:2,4-dienoyl-CoA reductase-like NADH-dependent reductase (Old Yellow Enzyme family)
MGRQLENRVRFSVEICRRIRATCGDRFIIGMTISGAEPYPGGLTIADKQEIVSHLDRNGLVDYFSCGTGSYLNQFSRIVPSFHYGMFLGTDDAAKFKEVVKHARVTAEARVKTPENAEKVIAEGKADMVSIVRGQIADPHLANKAKEGRPEDIRPCISCNQLCPAAACATTGSPASPIRRSRAKPSGTAIRRRRRRSRATCWWSAEALPASRSPASPPPAAIA